jgi:hypothetical protein
MARTTCRGPEQTTICLKGRGKYGYVTGDKSKPKTNSEEWETCDNRLMTSILNSIEPQLSEQFVT